MAASRTQVLVPIVMAVPLVVGMALVGVRGEVANEVIAVVLALAVVAAGVVGGWAGGVGAALVAAVTFDFFFTQPYLSLKIANGDDIVISLLLLAVGALAGASTQRHWPDDGELARGRAALLRVLTVANDGCAEDVTMSVRAELLTILQLQDCRFSPTASSLVELDECGRLKVNETVREAGDVRLPAEGVAIPVAWANAQFGALVAVPLPERVTTANARRIAVGLAQTLGLALAAKP